MYSRVGAAGGRGASGGNAAAFIWCERFGTIGRGAVGCLAALDRLGAFLDVFVCRAPWSRAFVMVRVGDSCE